MALVLRKRNRRIFLQKILILTSIKLNGVLIGKRSKLASRITIGTGSRLNANFLCRGQGEVIIGNYCAFGHNTRIITSNHPYDIVNLQYALQKEISGKLDLIEKKDVVIGHNVWVGDNVIVLPGISIGNGAIIGAGSVVTKHVSAYSIMAGNPAKFIKFRFSTRSIELIENTKWWLWSKQKMKNNKDLFIKSFRNE